MLPEVGCVPLQPPEATQFVAPSVVHVNVSMAACATTAEAAPIDTVGNGGGITVMGADALAVPPGPVQVIENEPVAIKPLRATAPEDGNDPDAQSAEHAVALVDDQLRVAVPPESTVDGLTEKESVGFADGPS